MPKTTTAPAPSLPPTDGSAGTEPSLTSRDFTWYWRAYTVSIFGDQVTLVALPIAVFARTQSALAVGIAASMQGATAVVFGLLAGVLADRLRHRPVLVATDLARAAVLGVVALMATRSSTYPVGVLYLAAFLLGAFGILHGAAAGSALPLVVRGRDLLRANGRLSGSESVGNAGGPALAGALTSISVGLAFAVDALTFAVSAIGMSKVRRFREAAPPQHSGASMGQDIREGLRAVASDRWVVKSMLLIAAMNVMAVAAEAQFIPFAKTLLHAGPVAIGVYFAIGGAAGVATAVALGRSKRTRGDAMILGVAAFGIGILLAGLFPSRAMVGVTYILAGSGAVLAITHWASLRQQRFPLRILGRVTVATRMVLLGVMPLAAVAGGAIASAAGSDTLFVVAGCVGLTACLVAWAAGLGALRLDDVITGS